MVKVCAVKNCLNSRNSKKKTKEASYSVSFFKPTTSSKLQRWTQSLGIALKATDYICQFHFKEKDIKMYEKIVIGNIVHLHETFRKKLKEEALPTIKHQFRINLEEQQHPKQQPTSVPEQQPPEREQQQPEQEQEQPGQEEEQQPESVPEREQQQQQLNSKIEHNYHQQQQQQQTPEIIPLIEYLTQAISVLPQYWLYVDGLNEIEFMRLDPASKQIRNHIVLNEDLSISVICSNHKKINIGGKISSPMEIFNYLKSVEKWPLCVGTQIEKRRYSKQCKGVIFGDETYQRQRMNPRCKSCRVLRNRLLQSRNRTFNRSFEKLVVCKQRTEHMIKQRKV